MMMDLTTAIDTISKKRRLDPSVQKIDELLELLEGWETRVRGGSDEAVTKEFAGLREQVQRQETKQVIAAHHKDVVSAATKLGKVADKVYPNLEHAVPHCSFAPELVYRAIYEHLLVSGRFEAARVFSAEAELVDQHALTEEMQLMYAACRELEAGGTELVSAWLQEHGHELRDHGAMLELEVLQLRFTQRVLSGDTAGALQTLRDFSTRQLLRAGASDDGSGPRPGVWSAPRMAGTKGVGQTYPLTGTSFDGARWPVQSSQLTAEARMRKLAGALAYAHQPASSPYAEMLNEPAQRAQLRDLFTKEYLLRLRRPASSSLETLVDAGTLALPKLAKLASVLKDKYARICLEGDTLPLEIDLGPRFVRHSVFTCPISKEAGTPDNPPMLLLCGHVLGLASITKLARGSRSARFKCPYCPVESSMDDAKALDL